MTTTPNTEDTLAAYVDQLREVTAAIRDYSEVESDLRGRIKDLVGDRVGVITAHGVPCVKVSYGKRFDSNLALAMLDGSPYLDPRSPSTIIETKTVTTVSSKLARAALPGSLYRVCQKLADTPTIEILDPPS